MVKRAKALLQGVDNSMFGIGMPEVILIFVIALLVFGPKELPKIARTVGKAMGELRRASDELRDGIQREIDLAERASETPPPPVESVPTTTTPEGASSPGESPGPAGVEAEPPPEPSSTSVETPVAENLPESTPPFSGDQVSPATVMEEGTLTASDAPESSETTGSAEKPGEHRPQAETGPHTPAQPVGTQNA